MKAWQVISIVVSALIIALTVDINGRRINLAQRDLAKANTANEMSMTWPSLDGACTTRIKWQPGESESEWQDRFNQALKKARSQHPLTIPNILDAK